MSGMPRRYERVRDRARVGRPGRVDVERLVGRQAPLVRAVVVADVDLFHDARFDGPGQAHTVAVGDERDLRAGDAAQRELRLEDLVGDGVGDEARVRHRRGELAVVGRLLLLHAEQPDLDTERIAALLDGADQQRVGARARATDRTGCPRASARPESTRRCRAGSCRTRARSSGRPRAPGRSSSRRRACRRRSTAR